MNATPALSKADTSGLDMEHFKKYEEEMRKWVDGGNIPGYCSAVVYQGKLLHWDAYGVADPVSKLQYGPNVLCRLYCMSKPYVAVAALMLQDRGLLSVHDPVAKYIPSFKNPRVVKDSDSVTEVGPLKPKPVTILHCLTHTAGLPYGSSFNEKPESGEEKMCAELVDGVEHGDIKSLAQFVDKLGQLPLRLVPGKEYHYSYGVDVVGRVVEVVSGMKLSKFLQQEIFQPLKMKDTCFSVPKSKANRFAALYASRASAVSLGRKPSQLPRKKGALCRIDGALPLQSRWIQGQSCAVESGGGFQGANMGGLVSTVSDSARFMAMVSNGGELDGVRILSEKAVQRFCLPDLFPDVITTGKKQRSDGKPFGWSALGEVGLKRYPGDPPVDTKDDFEVGECGGGGAACTYWSVNPRRDLAIVWFTQNMDNDPYVTEEQNIYLAARRTVPLSKRATTWKRAVSGTSAQKPRNLKSVAKTAAKPKPTTRSRAARPLKAKA